MSKEYRSIPILKNLIPQSVQIKGLCKFEHTYINSIESEIKDYLIKYGSLPIVKIEFIYNELKGIQAIDFKVQSGIIHPLAKPQN